MDTQDNLPKEYMQGFNNGYVFSKEFPDFSEAVVDQNMELAREDKNQHLTSKSGIIHGIQQANKKRELDILNDEKVEIDLIDRQREKGKDIEYDL